MRKKLSMYLWGLVWRFSEFMGIDLGNYAPYVFGKMLGVEHNV